MNLLRFVFRLSPGVTAFIIVTSMVSGAFNAGLIATVNDALNRSSPSGTTLAWAFLLFGIGKLFTSYISQLSLARFTQSAISRLRRHLVRQILAVPLRRLETIGVPRLMVALTEDVMSVTTGLTGLPLVAVNLALLLGGAVYLAWLSPEILVGIIVLVIVGAFMHRLIAKSGFRSLTLAREQQDYLFGHFRALTEGIKELKLHRNRRGTFLRQHVADTTHAFMKLNVAAEARFILAQHWSTALFYLLIAAVLFLVPTMHEVPPRTITGYILTTLYLMGPLNAVMGSFSYMGRASIALDRVEALGVSLQDGPHEHCPITIDDEPLRFRQLELRDVTHSYHSEKDDSQFCLGPINLAVQPGELVFVVGGNGSGKSTLAKVLTGLYPPETGDILLDGEVVDDASRDDYRQLFSAVFSDFFLFEQMMGMEGDHDLDVRAQEFLTQLQLQHKVRIENAVFSTTKLSQGQRKRLALLTAYLENRPFYIFDEWAADQDPQFKEVFYTRLLPDLVARGKAVVAITHDDKYFHLADRVVKLDCGQLVGDSRKDGSIGRRVPTGELDVKAS